MKRFRCSLIALGIAVGLSACQGQPAQALKTSEAAAPTPSHATAFTPTPTMPKALPSAITPSPTPRPTLKPEEWQTLPVIPTLSTRALAIYADGLARGNHPHVFSKVGDCESRTTWFLGDFDSKTHSYSLGPYADLQPVITYYAGSFGRTSLAAKAGFNTASLLANFWVDPQVCQKGENLLACEYRRNRPALAFIMLGTNDVSHPERFEKNMRQIIEFSISQGVLPVLATKADNLEGDHRINAQIAALAWEYDVPLWNYWAAVQNLPDHGLQADQAHLTYAPPDFDDPAVMQKAWPVRNLNALQILQKVMQATEK